LWILPCQDAQHRDIAVNFATTSLQLSQGEELLEVILKIRGGRTISNQERG